MKQIFALYAFLLLFICVAFSHSVLAQDEETDSPVAVEASMEEEATEQSIMDPIMDIAVDDYEARLKLARDMHEIWPIRPKIETALDNIADQAPEMERLKFKAALRNAIKFDALEEASIEAMADIFTPKELDAMIAFYGSKEGRSVSFKTADYERKIEPVLVKMIDKALLDIKLGAE